MCSKRNDFAGNEIVLLVVTSDRQRLAREQRSQIERSQRVEDDNLMRSIRVDGLVQGKVGRVVVERLIQC